MFKTCLDPNLYHGKDKKDNFFEGWYYKIVHPSRKLVFGFIPGIIFAESGKYSHSFIQFLEGSDSIFKYIKYEKQAFSAMPDKFDISIAENRFTLGSLSLNITQPDININGFLNFSNITRWPGNMINPGSMGFYNYLSFMQCYSQVCCMNAVIDGQLEINGEIIDFTGGKVYIEKNWGKAFPFSYIWAQCNSFNSSNTSFSCSIGHIPFPLGSFTGFLIGISFGSQFYKFTTINRSKIKIDINKNQLLINVKNKSHTLTLDICYKDNNFMDLYAPRDNKMVPIAKETLMGNVKISLKENSTGRTILEDEASLCGVEFSGDYRTLAKSVQKHQ